MPATVAGIHLGPDTHANRPAANASGLPVGALYICTDHDIIYKTDGSTWSNYWTGAGISEILTIPTAETDDSLVLAPDGAGGVEFRAEAGGVGDGGWDLSVDESGTTLTNWTVVNGTWSSDGAVIKETSAAGDFRFLRYTNPVLTALCVWQAELFFPSSNSGTDYGGVRIGSNSVGAGGCEVRIQRNTGTVDMELGSAGGTITFTYGTVAFDTWHTLRVLSSGSSASVWLNGTFLGSGGQFDSRDARYMHLMSHSSVTHFRNIKLWTPTLPA